MVTIAPPPISTRNHLEEAQTILEAFSGATRLSDEESALVETVLICGPEVLLAPGRARWDKLLAEATAPTPPVRWLHGIEHMTQAPTGELYWRGAQLPVLLEPGPGPARRARRIAELCSELEMLGKTVDSKEALLAFEHLRFGEGIPSYRVHVLWTMRPDDQCLTAAVELSTSLAEATANANRLQASLSKQWGCEPSQVRHSLICSMEDAFALSATVQRDQEWLNTMFASLVRDQDARRLPEMLIGAIDPDEFPSSYQLEHNATASDSRHELPHD